MRSRSVVAVGALLALAGCHPTTLPREAKQPATSGVDDARAADLAAPQVLMAGYEPPLEQPAAGKKAHQHQHQH